MNSLDARVRYTRRVIEENFLDLLRQKPVSRITVTELCQRAQINRATFYKHYLDVPDLLEKLEEHFMEKVLETFTDTERIRSFLTELLEYIRGDGRRYMILASDGADPAFPSKLFARCLAEAGPLLEKSFPRRPEKQGQLVYSYLAYGSGAVLRCWVQDGMAEEPEEVAELLLALCAGAIAGAEAGTEEKKNAAAADAGGTAGSGASAVAGRGKDGGAERREKRKGKKE